MKIACLTKDTALVQQLAQHKRSGYVQLEFFTTEAALQVSLPLHAFDWLIICDREYSFATLCELVERIKEQYACKMMLLISNQHSHYDSRKMIKYCLAHGLSYIHPGQTVAQIVDGIYKQICNVTTDNNDRSNIVLFIGTTPNIGTTVVSYATALHVAMRTTQQVAYVCLNLKSSKIHRYLGLPPSGSTLNTMRAELKAKGMTARKIKDYGITSKEADNLHVLLGNLAREQAEFYTVDDIQHLLQCVSEAYDLCIVEVNAYWDNAATMCALFEADSKIVVSTAQLGHFQEDLGQWLHNMSSLYNLERQMFDLFITQVDKAAHDFNVKHIRKETGMNIVGTMPKHAHISGLLNEGMLEQIVHSEPHLLGGISGVANMLMTLYALQRKPSMPKKHWFAAPKRLGG